MNWEAIGAVAELLAAVGVIFSLIFVGVQIRKSAELLRHENLETSIDRTIGSTALFATNEQVSEIFLRGIVNYEELSDVEKFRFSSLMTGLIADWWDQYLKHSDGRMADDVWALNMTNMNNTIKSPGVKQWLASTKTALPRDFIQTVSGSGGT